VCREKEVVEEEKEVVVERRGFWGRSRGRRRKRKRRRRRRRRRKGLLKAMTGLPRALNRFKHEGSWGTFGQRGNAFSEKI
jgi:hypothetical protein